MKKIFILLLLIVSLGFTQRRQTVGEPTDTLFQNYLKIGTSTYRMPVIKGTTGQWMQIDASGNVTFVNLDTTAIDTAKWAGFVRNRQSYSIVDELKTFDIAFIAPNVSYSYKDSLLNIYLTQTDTVNFALSIPFSIYSDSIGLDSLVLTTKGDASSYVDYIKLYSVSYGQKTEKYSSMSNVNFTGANQSISFGTEFMLANNQPILLELGININSYVYIYDIIAKCKKSY